MKQKITLLFIATLLMVANVTYAQTEAPKFKDGHVWSVTMVKTKTGMSDDYMKQLAGTLVKVQNEAVKQGIILSYKVLRGTSANEEDFDVLLLEEYTNMAALDGVDAKWEAVFQKTIGDDEAMKKLMQTRLEVRTIYGEKLMREVNFQ